MTESAVVEEERFAVPSNQENFDDWEEKKTDSKVQRGYQSIHSLEEGAVLG